MASNPVNPAGINWPRISETLERLASAWCREAKLPDVFDGVDAQDVVSETWTAYFGSPTQLGWDPRQAPLEIFLWGVCRHKLMTHLRRQMHIAESLDDENRASSRDLTYKEPSQHEMLEAEDGARKFARELFDRISKIKRKPEELKAVVNAAISIEEPEKINQQLSSMTNFPIDKVESIKKRLRRIRPIGEKFRWKPRRRNSETE